MIVSFITRNSAERLRYSGITLHDVLNSSLQIPYKSIILVDDSSAESKTIQVFREWCDAHNKELVVSNSRYSWNGRSTRATARQTAIDIFFENFKDDFLMFVDDDVILRDGWWRWIEENRVLEDDEVGEVWGINWDVASARKGFLDLCCISFEKYLVKRFRERGGTHDTIYRREALKGISIPPELHVYEDAYIHFWISRAGWKSVINPIGVLHYPSGPPSGSASIEEIKESIRLAIKYGVYEGETLKKYSSSRLRRMIGYLSLTRPILGFLPISLNLIRSKNLNRTEFMGICRQQYLKLWAKWHILKASKTLRQIIREP